ILPHQLTSCIKVPVDLPTNVSTSTTTTQDYEDLDTANLSEAEIRERYRRLIPYMTYYVLNNYLQQPQQKPVAAPVSPHPRPAAKQRYNLQPPQRPMIPENERFVPSVQYNPKEIGSEREVDYFVPVRYNNRPKEQTTPQQILPAYEDYGAVRTFRPPPMTITVPETHYRTSPRPSTSFAPQKLKLSPLAKFQQPQQPPLDYSLYNQAAAEEFESVRFTTPRPQPALRYPPQQPVAPRPTVLEPVPLQAHVSLSNVLKSLQLTNQLPEVLSKDNIDSSIKTLVEILNILNLGKKQQNYAPAYQKPVYTKPKVITESNYQATQLSVTPHNELVQINPASAYINHIKSQMPAPIPAAPLPHHEDPIEVKPLRQYIQPQTEAPAPPRPPVNDKIIEYYVPIVQDIDVEKPTYNPVKEHNTEQSTVGDYRVDEHRDEILEDERFSLPVNTEAPTQGVAPPSLKYGATRGKPHIDYPAYTDIPETNFNCKQQRYKGFFGDPETGCQVWHYCDLNGGKSSFLCPNGTIFSQVALTCDWWFNVKCESTTQLYVLNERLYKYILPVVPKFPEDFSGPEVDKYLELKFREMEAKMKEKKKKKAEEKDKDAINTLQSIEDSK
ncbi:hypothetical protein TSAR_011281, partial [Trichomalopsis sarcophagae]